MRILFSCVNPPLLAHGGAAMTKHTIVRYLLEAGHEVSVLYLEPIDYGSGQRETDHDAVVRTGVESVRSVPWPRPVNGFGDGLLNRVRRRLVYTPAAFRPWFRQASLIRAEVAQLRPSVCLLYGFEPIEAFLTVTSVPKVAGVGVFRHKLGQAARRLDSHDVPVSRRLLRMVAYPLWQRYCLRNDRELLASVDGAWFLADNYARYCRERLGLNHVVYLPNPVLDEREDLCAEASSHPTRPFQIVMVGHLRGTATRSGLKFFAERMLPILAGRGESAGFEFLIVGKFTPPDWLAQRLQRANVRFLGFVDNFAETVHRADVVLVPIPDDVGNRSRIVSAFSAEACVVTHASSCLGMPELRHEENCLVADTARGLVEQMARACRDRALNRRLRAGGRRAYERFFHPRVACRRIEELLQHTVEEWARRRGRLPSGPATSSDIPHACSPNADEQ